MHGTTPRDIYTEPADVDAETLEHLGPLTALAGTWEGRGLDHHPVRSTSPSPAR